jgi:hypothetical protein
MTFEPRSYFFSGLSAYLVGRPHLSVGSGTETGRNLYSTKTKTGGLIFVTANIAPRDTNRVSVKLTIARDLKGAPTPVYDSIANRHKPFNALWGDSIDWERESGESESRVQVARYLALLDARSIDAQFPWIERNACILLEWAIEASSI